MKQKTYPYIPNSAPEVKAAMLAAIGANSIEELYAEIPPELRMRRPMDLPEPLLSEHALKRHVQSLLALNRHCGEVLSLLGGGCYQHHVPAVCDEINGRSEFLTAYAGEPYDDAGRFQALFEYASMMGELLEMEVVSIPTFDGHQAAATAVRMAERHTGRSVVLVGGAREPREVVGDAQLWPQRPASSGGCASPATATSNLDVFGSCLGEQVACLYIDNPSTWCPAGRRRRLPPRFMLAARCWWWASTRAASAWSRHLRVMAPTSSAATSSRSGCT